jgi:hypothetical protein
MRGPVNLPYDIEYFSLFKPSAGKIPAPKTEDVTGEWENYIMKNFN